MSEVIFADRLPLHGTKDHADGYLTARVHAARTGVYLYAGDEVGKPEMSVVRVFRPLDEVFAISSLGSFKGKPITDGHPKERVTADNHTALSRGHIAGVARDGEAVALDVALMDAALIQKVKSGAARELSPGYVATLDWTGGTSPSGEPYDAVQRDIYVDHLAVVEEARGGSELRIGDGAKASVVYPIEKPNRAVMEDHMSESSTMKIVVVDGKSIKTDDAGAILIDQLSQDLAAAKGEAKELADQVSAGEKAIQTKDGEIAALNTKLADAKVTPQQLRDMAKSYAATAKTAKDMGVSEEDMKDMDEAEMKKAAVKKKMGDRAASFTDAQIDGAFAAFADAPPATPPGKAVLSDGVRPAGQTAFTDSVLASAGVKLKKEA